MGHANVSRLLLAQGADPSASAFDGFSAMLEACGGGHRTVVELLIDHGANVTLAPGSTSPLLMSCLYGHADITTLLLEHRANASQARSDGFSPLRAACGNGHADVARLLLRQTPCDSPDGVMALKCAPINGHREVAQLLVENSVPTKSEVSYGTSVWWWCVWWWARVSCVCGGWWVWLRVCMWVYVCWLRGRLRWCVVVGVGVVCVWVIFLVLVFKFWSFYFF